MRIYVGYCRITKLFIKLFKYCYIQKVILGDIMDIVPCE